jgi:hypothetical protein
VSATELYCGSVMSGTVCGLVEDLRRRDLGSCQGNGRVPYAVPEGTGTLCCLFNHSNESTNQMQQFLMFITCRLNYSSTCFGHPHAHHQELQQLQ